MWSQSDIIWLEKNYPTLRVVDEHTIEGKLPYRMLHREGENFIKPNGALVSENGGVYLCDTYSLKLLWPDNLKYPYAYETDGRIASTAQRLGKDLLDLHLLTGKQKGALCLASPMELKAEFHDEFSMQKYVEEFLIPYFFGQTYYASNGKWPWPELSHGYPGHLEWLAQHPAPTRLDIFHTALATAGLQGDADQVQTLFSTRPRPHLPCFCGSGKKTHKCHPDAQKGISIIRGAISQHQFAISDLIATDTK